MDKREELDKMLKEHPEVLLVDKALLVENSLGRGKYLLVKDESVTFLIGAALPIEKHAELLYVFMKRVQYTELYVYGGGLFNQQDRKLYEASTVFGEPPLNPLRAHVDALGVASYTIQDAVPGDASPFSKKFTIEEVEKLLML